MDDVLLLVGSFQVSAVTWVDFSPLCDRPPPEPRLSSGGGLSGLPGVSNGTSLSAWGCVYVCYSPMVTALMSTCVNGENMHSIMPVHWEWAAVNSITHRVSICVGSLGVIFLSRWSIYVCPQVKIYCCIPHTHKHTHFLKLFKTCLHAGNNMFWYVAGALTNP